jgi:hypothetical protein
MISWAQRRLIVGPARRGWAMGDKSPKSKNKNKKQNDASKEKEKAAAKAKQNTSLPK